MSKKNEEVECFEVKNEKFYILEQRIEDEEDDSKIKIIAWVYQNEKDAIIELNKFIADEDVDLEESLDESIEYLSSKYNLQEVQIEKDKYNMKSISWLKIAMVGIASKKNNN